MGQLIFVGAESGGAPLEVASVTELAAIDGLVDRALGATYGYDNAIDLGGGLWWWDIAAVGANTWDAVGPGALGKWRRMLISGLVSARYFGATGDGATDDTLALQAWLDHLSDNKASGFLPAGNYRITATLIIDNEVYICGEGRFQSIIQADFAGADSIAVRVNGDRGPTCQGITLEHFGIENIDACEYGLVLGYPGAVVGPVSAGVRAAYLNINFFENANLELRASQISSFYQCRFRGSYQNGGDGLRIPALTNNPNLLNSFNSCAFIQCMRGVWAENGNDTKFYDCEFESNWQEGIRVDRSADANVVFRNFTVFECYFEGNNGDPARVSGFSDIHAAIAGSTVIQDFRIDKCSFTCSAGKSANFAIYTDRGTFNVNDNNFSAYAFPITYSTSSALFFQGRGGSSPSTVFNPAVGGTNQIMRWTAINTAREWRRRGATWFVDPRIIETSVDPNGGSGTHAVGDVAFLNTATRGSIIGWRCIVAGTPGTWESFGPAPLTGSATWDPPNLADGAATSTTLTVTGAVVGNIVGVSHSQGIPGGMLLVGSVTAPDTVTATLVNHTGAPVDIASGTLRAMVWKV